mgnify:CR=1 FL=1
MMRPFLIRKGLYTSSMVPESLPMAAAKVSSPTGPPMNFSIMVIRIRRSI